MKTALAAKDLKLTRQKETIARKERKIRSHQKLFQKRKLAVKRYGKSMINRTRKLITKTLVSVPGEAMPVIGAFVVAGGTAYEIYTACQNLKDIQQLQLEFGVGEMPEKGIMGAVCDKIQ